MDSPEFPQFLSLPKELRLEIWKFAIPPRIIELKFIDTNDPTREILYNGGTGTWAWIATSDPYSPLLHVNKEARDFFAHTLKSYETLPIYDQSQPGHHIQTYIEFSTDVIYLSRYSHERLLGVFDGKFPGIQHTESWTSKTVSLAVDLGMMTKPRYMFNSNRYREYKPKDRYERLCTPGGREEAARYLYSMFKRFPKLRQLTWILDGRNPSLGGYTQLVQATEEHGDFHVENGRDVASRWIPGVMEGLRSMFPSLRLPTVQLAVLTNGQDSESVERRWDYFDTCCRFCKPEGYRPPSVSEELMECVFELEAIDKSVYPDLSGSSARYTRDS